MMVSTRSADFEMGVHPVVYDWTACPGEAGCAPSSGTSHAQGVEFDIVPDAPKPVGQSPEGGGTQAAEEAGGGLVEPGGGRAARNSGTWPGIGAKPSARASQ